MSEQTERLLDTYGERLTVKTAEAFVKWGGFELDADDWDSVYVQFADGEPTHVGTVELTGICGY